MPHPPRFRRTLAVFAALMMATPAGAAGADTPEEPQPYGSPGGSWKLQFSDDFLGPGLDPEKWSNGYGWGDRAERRYSYCHPDHNRVAAGLLTQRIERKPRDGRRFATGCVHTKDRFAQLYGYWEARIRVAGCRGARSAFWAKANSEAWPPELDVIEVLGSRRREAQFTVHWEEQGRHRMSKGVVDGPEFYEDFHIFAAQWTPTETIWYVDGFELRRTRAGATAMDDRGPFYTMVEAHVLDPDSYCGIYRFFSQQQVDYVRIWSRR